MLYSFFCFLESFLQTSLGKSMTSIPLHFWGNFFSLGKRPVVFHDDFPDMSINVNYFYWFFFSGFYPISERPGSIIANDVCFWQYIKTLHSWNNHSILFISVLIGNSFYGDRGIIFFENCSIFSMSLPMSHTYQINLNQFWKCWFYLCTHWTLFLYGWKNWVFTGNYLGWIFFRFCTKQK